MRIGLILETFDPAGGGAERWTAQFHDHLRRAGHEVHVIAFAARGHDTVEHLHLLTDPGTLLGRAEAVAAAVARLPPMVLHDSGTGWSAHVFHPQTGSRLLSLERMMSARGIAGRLRWRVDPRMIRLRRIMARIEDRAARQATRVIAVSRVLRDLLAARHGIDPARIATIPNGVDTARFDPARLAPLRALAREQLGLGAQELMLLMVAHNLWLKGVDTALRALTLARAQGAVARLVICGGVPDADWHALVARLGVAEHVVFAGDVPEVQRLYAAADAMLHPTRWDACSLATIEGMAAALPVVSSTANGAADLIEDGVSGHLLHRATDHEALAAIILALRDGALRRRIGQAAHHAARSADIARNCAAVEAVLHVAAEQAGQSLPG
ncbi:glycosyltransferase family 4 protein [Roseomonas fluvialis]|uniref:GDP-mannose-dependent alpha-(1-6)-phosphatidylinositol monomannoside mannosyltransferase n=1 Tax=Roseomonas fluvialis TaxID=1750527 RepID=A0ABM8I5V4_9PROT|nr:glycosyltransferase family 4 protein [Roseomonas fluvialis]BDG72345.1 GDP-mannose-dependent alpha-(1-6)-phosphatidylinositol monomannoside mannosyltransferase [Roseomonas fluvialis]